MYLQYMKEIHQVSICLSIVHLDFSKSKPNAEDQSNVARNIWNIFFFLERVENFVRNRENRGY